MPDSRVTSIVDRRKEKIERETAEAAHKILRRDMKMFLRNLHATEIFKEKHLSRTGRADRKRQIGAWTKLILIALTPATLKIFASHSCVRCKLIVITEIHRRFFGGLWETLGEYRSRGVSILEPLLVPKTIKKAKHKKGNP